MSLILLAALIAGLLFWLAPLIRRLIDRLRGVERNQRPSVLIASFVLRGLVVGLIAVLWLGLTQYRQTVPATTKARIDVLVDVSESLVHPDAPGAGDYLSKAEDLSRSIIDALDVPTEVNRRVFAQGSRSVERFGNAVGAIADVGGSLTGRGMEQRADDP